jgi:cysteine-rich repeat protein
MYHRVLLSPIWRATTALVLVLAFGAPSAGAQDVNKCKAAVIKGAQKLAGTRMKALAKCEGSNVKAALKDGSPVACPDSKATDKISKAEGKLNDGIGKACSGVSLADLGFAGLVDRCSGGDRDGERCADDADCPDGGTCAPGDECPALLNGSLGCDGMALSTPASVAGCLACTTAAKVDTLVATFYSVLDDLSSATDKQAGKCAGDVGKRTAKFFAAAEKVLAKCEAALLKGKVASCPDSAASGKIADAAGKLAAAIAKSCDSDVTLARALNPGKVYGLASRWGSCGVTGAGTVAGLSSLLECVAKNAASCDVALSTGNNTCSSQLCGNGQIDAGETCDDGNTLQDSGLGSADTCPADCAVAACVPDGVTNVQVNFSSPVSLLGLTVLLSYDDSKVSIPGTSNQAPVQAAMTSANFATDPTDVDYAVRVVMNDPLAIGYAAGEAFSVAFNRCQGAPAPAAADFACMVVDAGDTNFAQADGVTCSVSVLP